MTSTSGLYKRTEIIGKGKFGVVYKGYNKQTRKVVAIKVLNLDTEEDEVVDVQQEIQFLSELKNAPNVTHYYGSFLNDTKLWIIMDYCAGGSVRALLKAGVFEDKYIAIVFRELLIALQTVHKMGLIHRDLKAANVLITNEGNVQLCDFGVATQLSANALKRTTMAGTPYWMAPEVIREGDTYNSKADIWSLGITLYEIATGNPPYCDRDVMWAMLMISKLTPPRLEGRQYSAALKEAVSLCLDENPEERPSAEELMKSKLVKIYKNHSTSLLREVISRYLIWRDGTSQSEPTAYSNLDDGINMGSRDDSTSNNQIQVKWDFDSLSSKEYIIENDIDMNRVGDGYLATDYSVEEDVGSETYQTRDQTTLQASKIHQNSTTASNNINNTLVNKSQDQEVMKTPSSGSEIPKSLMLLFETSPELEASSDLNMENDVLGLRPSLATNDTYIESPTIEIPDMDNMESFASGNPASTNTVPNTSANANFAFLNKPPTLLHSKSTAGSTDSRLQANRPRKKTISNTFGSTNSAQNLNLLPSPSSSQYKGLKTPSPKVPSSNAASSAVFSSTSPSKSMKALKSNPNPLLQPINLKLNVDSLKTANNVVGVSGSTIPAAGSSAQVKPRKTRADLHIQMPTPSNIIDNLSALTGEIDGHQSIGQSEHINQFGINPAQVAQFPLTMTPVAERDGMNYPVGEDSEALYQNGNKTPLSLPKPTSVSVHHLAKSSVSSSSLPGQIRNQSKFPPIPALKNEIFLDSTPRLEISNEVVLMIHSFNSALETFANAL